MSVATHSIIPKNILQNTYKHVSAIDSVLSLHYTNHITNPSLAKVLDTAASLIHLRINFMSLEVIFAISPDMYDVFIDENNAYTISPKNISIHDFKKYTSKRKEQFLADLNKWIMENSDKPVLPTVPMSKIVTKVVKNSRTSPYKITKSSPSPSPNSSRVNLLQDFKNESGKFRFKSKDEVNTNGLSLLERIKLKEKLNKEKKLMENPQQKYESYINDKMLVVYDIIYELRGGHGTLDNNSTGNSKSYPLQKLISQIEDSLEYPISKSEIYDVIKSVSSKLLNEKVEVISRDGLSIVKIAGLKYDTDVKLLKL